MESLASSVKVTSTSSPPEASYTTVFPSVPETLSDPWTEFVFTSLQNDTAVASSTVTVSSVALGQSPSPAVTGSVTRTSQPAETSLIPSISANGADDGGNDDPITSETRSKVTLTTTSSAVPPATSSTPPAVDLVVSTSQSIQVVTSSSTTIKESSTVILAPSSSSSTSDILPETFSVSTSLVSHAALTTTIISVASTGPTSSRTLSTNSQSNVDYNFISDSAAVSTSSVSQPKSTATTTRLSSQKSSESTKQSTSASSTASSIAGAGALDLDSSVTSFTSSHPTATTFVTDGKTLSGSAALAALAAATASASNGASSTTKNHGNSLSSFAIVGIVGGILVFIIVYVVWYQWRKKRRNQALDEDATDDNEKRDQRRSTRSSFGNDPFDDVHTAYTESLYRPRTEYTEHQTEAMTGQWDGELARELEYLEDEEEPSRRGLSTYQSDLTAALMDDGATVYGAGNDRDREDDHGRPVSMTELRTADLVPRTADPFKPPPPVPRGMSGYSDPFDLSSRPETQMTDSRPATRESRPGSYTYGSIYDGYSNSRPSTRYEQEPKTPATSTLLPWMSGDRRSSAPPVPPVPPLPQSNQRTLVQRQPRQRQVEDPRRSPPAAVMAQTPLVAKGDAWPNGIPSFR